MMSAEAAAALLGVTRRTLYAYVSRGLVASEPGPGPSRARRYPRAQIEQLAKRRHEPPGDRAARAAMSWGPAVADSALTLIAGGRLYYRGRDAVRLSRSASLEDVAGLLWTGRTDGGPGFPSGRAGRPSGGTHLARMERWLTTDAARGMASVGSPDTARLRAAAQLVSGLFAAAGAPGDGPLADRLARGWGTPRADALGAALVLCADHELNVSAFTARCVASADARLEHVVLAALCAFQGRRHGGMAARVAAMLDAATRGGARAAVDEAFAVQGQAPGFGHPLYPDGDPRAAELLRICPAPRGGDATAGVATICRDELGLAPNLDFALGAVERRLGLAEGCGAALFALGRSVGWIAHAIEAWTDGALIRPRARYVGPDPETATAGEELPPPPTVSVSRSSRRRGG